MSIDTPRRVPTRRKIAFAAIFVLAAVMVCEAGARLFLPAPPDAGREPQLVYRTDPEVGFVMAPNQKAWIDDGLVTVNSLGFRGPEVVSPKPAGAYRVVVIGDSVALGWGVGDAETFPAQLERLMHERLSGRDLTVVNLGVSGYDTFQAVGLLKRNLSRLEPDLVVLGFYPNDVPTAQEDNSSNGPGSTVAPAKPASDRIMHMNATPSSWWNRQLRKSRVIYAVGHAVNVMRGAGEQGTKKYLAEMDMLRGTDSPEIIEGWSRVAKQLAKLRDLAASGGFSAAIVALPCKEQVMGQFPDEKYQSRLRALAQPLGLAVIDPLPLLTAKSASSQELFVAYDRNHPSPAGHRFIAEAISRYVEEHHLVSPKGH